MTETQATPERPLALLPIPAQVAATDRLALRAPVFVSDLHLRAQQPATLQGFLRFLEALDAETSELVILGDLFEIWAGDDSLAVAGTADATADDAVGATVAQALHAVEERGITVYLMHGNRDLLLGPAFLRASGAHLLADPAIALLGEAGSEQTTLLAHGDAYCTLDLPYQAFRRQAHDARFQAAFLARPLLERRALLGQARIQSEAGKQQMAMTIMDVTGDAIVAALRGAGVRHMIHGHTHRPARHELEVDAEPATRWVLPDWDLDATPVRGGALRWAGGALQAIEA